MPRIVAGLVALAAWAGLAVQFYATYSVQHDAVATSWILLRYFTIITNLLVAAAMSAVAAGRRVSPVAIGGITVAILLVGGVYAALLEQLYQLKGADRLADILLHKISPVLMACWWLLFAPRHKLRWSAPLWWGLYPLAYFGYALVRGQFDGKYPYPFIDVGAIGWARTLSSAFAIAGAFVLAGLALVGLERWRPLGSRRPSR